MYKKYISVLATIVLLVIGIWLLGKPGAVAPEPLARIVALSTKLDRLSVSDSELEVDNSEVIVHQPEIGSSIDLKDLPEEVDKGDSLYQRWLRGEIDLDEDESLLSPEQEALLMKELSDKGPSENIESPEYGLESLYLERSFSGPDIRECCTTTNQGTVPPDPEIAAGRNYVIVVVNIAFEIYNKQGVVVWPHTTFSSLFSGISGCNNLGNLFDPNVLYDEAANRFFLGIASDAGYYCTAVSATSDPTGTWNRYRISTTASGGFFDYPHAGVGRDAIYLGANMFSCSTCPYRDSRVWAFDKWAMYSNSATSVVERAVPGGQARSTPQPANLHGFLQGTWPSSGPHYYIVDENFNGSTYSVFQWSNPFGSNTFSLNGTFNMTAATGVFPIMPFASAAQQGSSNRIKTNDWRVQDNEYRNGYLWTTNTITCNPGGGNVTCVRWAQVNPSNGTIIQAGVLGSNGEFRYFGDLAANHCSDMAIGYTKSSTSHYPGIWVAGRDSTDPSNSIDGEVLLKAGERPYFSLPSPPFRWGDYTGMTSDPNGRDFWYVGEFSKNVSHPFANWGTHIGCYVATSCTPPQTQEPIIDGEGVSVASSIPSGGWEYFSFLPTVVNDPYVPCGF